MDIDHKSQTRTGCRIKTVELTGRSSLHIEEEMKSNTVAQGFGGTIWDSSASIIKFFEFMENKFNNSDDTGSQRDDDKNDGVFFLERKRVLELGAGTGIVGLALARMGAAVTLTDRAPLAPLLRRNAARNFPAPALPPPPRVHVLQWGVDAPPPPPEDGDAASSSWDWVVGSDITYSEEGHPGLLATLREAVPPTAFRTTCLIADEEYMEDIEDSWFWNQIAQEFDITIFQNSPSDKSRDGMNGPCRNVTSGASGVIIEQGAFFSRRKQCPTIDSSTKLVMFHRKDPRRAAAASSFTFYEEENGGIAAKNEKRSQLQRKKSDDGDSSGDHTAMVFPGGKQQIKSSSTTTIQKFIII